jgi:hypothetical protein
MRVNVSPNHPDKIVQEVVDRLDRRSPVDGALGDSGVQGVVEQMFRDPARPRSFGLDLIAHARRGVLQIGDWTVDGGEPTLALRAACDLALHDMPMREIRLLGCNTAVKPAGRTAMRQLAELFGARVWGTKAPISANDFDHSEFRSTGLLADQREILRFAVPRALGTARWFTGFAQARSRTLRDLASELREESEAEVFEDWNRAALAARWPIRVHTRAQLETLFDHIQPGMASVPGILALPELEIVVRMADRVAPRFHRLTVLLDHELVRVYPRGMPSGCVFRVRPGPAFRAAVDLGDVIRS